MARIFRSFPVYTQRRAMFISTGPTRRLLIQTQPRRRPVFHANHSIILLSTPVVSTRRRFSQII